MRRWWLGGDGISVQGGLQQLGRAANSEQWSGFPLVRRAESGASDAKAEANQRLGTREMGSRARRPRGGETRDCWRGVICAKSAMRNSAIGAGYVCEEISHCVTEYW